jgi:glycine/D-amino acid oxidase-like deaminating enzyme
MRSEDVVIVGAGFAGAATAWTLRERGIRAVVLEREPSLGVHASGRGAGLGRVLAEDDDTSRLTIRGAQLLRERFAAHWKPTGGFLTFDREDAAAEYRDRASRFDVPYEMVDRNAIHEHWPIEVAMEAAMFCPRDGVIDNVGLLRAFAGDVELGTAVQRISASERGAVVETNRGAIEARCVVDGSGAWAGSWTRDPPLETFKRHLFVVEMTAATDAPYLWHVGERERYLRPHADGVLACACDAERVEPMAQEPSSDADARCEARLPGSVIIKRWACQRAFAPDRKMRVGRDPSRPWLVWAAALGGHGATASAAVGERAAAAVMEVLDERA